VNRRLLLTAAEYQVSQPLVAEMESVVCGDRSDTRGRNGNTHVQIPVDHDRADQGGSRRCIATAGAGNRSTNGSGIREATAASAALDHLGIEHCRAVSMSFRTAAIFISAGC
jgi:hypothetical protein